MKQETFIARHAEEWAQFECWLERCGGGGLARLARPEPAWDGLDDAEVPARYRRLCHQAALARRRGYGPQLNARLQVLMQRGHDLLYRAPPTAWWRAGRFLLADFPRLVRAQRGCLWLAAALLSGAMIGMYWLVSTSPELAHSVLSPKQLAGYEMMYSSVDPGSRASGDNVKMFGFYVMNNVSIGFRTFASGLMAGVGTLAVLVFNGLLFGTVAAHVVGAGHGAQLWPFVAGHSALELIAIVIAGAAGLRLGLALVAPGRLRRVDALRRAGKTGALLCIGMFVMLLLAAFVEAFWSSQHQIAPWVKYTVGAVLWVLVVAWLGWGGRGLDVEERDAA